MNKILLFVIISLGAVTNCLAQTKSTMQLSIGGEFGVPVGQASEVYGKVLGASLKFEVPVSKSPFSIVITSGISSFLVKYDYTGILDNASYIPVEAGGKYYFSKIGYFEADFGVSNNINTNYTAAKTAFIYSPVIGLSAPTNKPNKHKHTIDIGVRYEGRVESGGTVGQLALRIAYRFPL
ncbi:MAG TPA: hypothetical protein VGI43_02655 [Mucilaginibacter sp.]|jgi:hypothetical protein